MKERRRKAACRRLPLQTQRSQCALLPRGDAKGDAVPRLVRAASPLGEATGATRRNESLRGFLRKSYISVEFTTEIS